MKHKSEFEITCAYGGERDKRNVCDKSYKSKLYQTLGTGFNAQLAIWVAWSNRLSTTYMLLFQPKVHGEK